MTQLARYRAIAGFSILLIAIITCIFWIDRPVALDFAAMKQEHPGVISVFQKMTTLGKSQWYLYPLAAYCLGVGLLIWWRPEYRPLWRPRLLAALFIFANVALSGLAVDLLKIIIGRPRPVLLIDHGIFNQFTPWTVSTSPLGSPSRWWSLPSGHSVTALALALALGALWPRCRWAILAFAGIIGASRVIVTAHYLGDILAGFGVAVLIFMLLEYIFKQRGWAIWIPPQIASPR